MQRQHVHGSQASACARRAACLHDRWTWIWFAAQRSSRERMAAALRRLVEESGAAGSAERFGEIERRGFQPGGLVRAFSGLACEPLRAAIRFPNRHAVGSRCRFYEKGAVNGSQASPLNVVDHTE